MATILESATISRHSDLQRSFPAPVKSYPPVYAISCSRRDGAFREFRGLKIQSVSEKTLAALNSRRSSRVLRRGGEIVCESQETALHVPPVTDATWQSLVVKSDGPVMVEFYAPWCGPCRMLHPVVSELSEQYAGKLKCYKLNTDESPSIATQYGIRSVPTIMILIDGEKKVAILGAVPKTTLCSSIEKFL